MKCPECNNEMRHGDVKASANSLFVNLSWFPDETKKKFLKKGVALKIYGDGWYCDECMKVFACFDEK